jgi:hypothetical protein
MEAKIAINKVSEKKQKSGQALIEFIPVLFAFLFIFTAAMSFFEVMKNATIVQEMGRNLAFAKIANSGTLTTPLDQSFYMARYGAFSGNDGISMSNECFTVLPRKSNYAHEVKKIFGIDAALQVRMFTKAVVYRRPGNACQSP